MPLSPRETDPARRVLDSALSYFGIFINDLSASEQRQALELLDVVGGPSTPSSVFARTLAAQMGPQLRAAGGRDNPLIANLGEGAQAAEGGNGGSGPSSDTGLTGLVAKGWAISGLRDPDGNPYVQQIDPETGLPIGDFIPVTVDESGQVRVVGDSISEGDRIPKADLIAAGVPEALAGTLSNLPFSEWSADMKALLVEGGPSRGTGTGTGSGRTAAQTLGDQLANTRSQLENDALRRANERDAAGFGSLVDVGDGILFDPATREFIDPSSFGLARDQFGFTSGPLFNEQQRQFDQGLALDTFNAESANSRAALSAATQGFQSVNQLAPQLGQLALDNAGFFKDTLSTPSDYLARAFFQGGAESPQPFVSQADIINALRSNIQGFNSVLGSYNTGGLNAANFPTAPTYAPGTPAPAGGFGNPVTLTPPPKDLASPEAAPSAVGGDESVAPSADPTDGNPSPGPAVDNSSVFGPPTVTVGPGGSTVPLDQFQQIVSPNAQSGTGTYTPPVQTQTAPSINGRTALDNYYMQLGLYGDQGTPLGFFNGGFVNDPAFVTGEPAPGRLGKTGEMVLNPTGAPLAVVPNDQLRNGMARPDATHDAHSTRPFLLQDNLSVRGFAEGTGSFGFLKQLEDAVQARFGTTDFSGTTVQAAEQGSTGGAGLQPQPSASTNTSTSFNTQPSGPLYGFDPQAQIRQAQQTAPTVAPAPAPAPAPVELSATAQNSTVPVAGYDRGVPVNAQGMPIIPALQTGGDLPPGAIGYRQHADGSVEYVMADGSAASFSGGLTGGNPQLAGFQQTGQIAPTASAPGGQTGFQAPQLPVPPEVAQEDLVAKAWENLPPRILSLVQGERPSAIRFPMELFTPQNLSRLTADDLEALQVFLATVYNVSLQDVITAQNQRFGPTRVGFEARTIPR